jgi:hypothetical protein
MTPAPVPRSTDSAFAVLALQRMPVDYDISPVAQSTVSVSKNCVGPETIFQIRPEV